MCDTPTIPLRHLIPILAILVAAPVSASEAANEGAPAGETPAAAESDPGGETTAEGENGGPAAPAATRPAVPTLQQRQEMVRLGHIARGNDWPAAKRALEALEDFGTVAEGIRRNAVRQWLLGDRQLVVRGLRLLPDRRRIDAMQEAIDERRAAARQIIQNLGREGVEQMAEHRQVLTDMTRAINESYMVMAAAIEAISRRPALLAWWAQLGPEQDRLFGSEAEAALAASVTETWDLDAEAIALVTDFNNGRAPEQEPLRGLWFYIACRSIEAHNQTLKPLMDEREWRNAELVNAYREALGILPVELDARLIQAARRHSREMHELRYFAHVSPTPENRTHTARMRNAGYPRPYSENIARGRADGEATFRQWFNSPGHHRNMVNQRSTALGVGRWQTVWTQKFGVGQRVMTMNEAERQAVTVNGPILEPDTTPIPTRRAPRIPRRGRGAERR